MFLWVNNEEILVKMTLKSGGWQSQSQWSSVVLMHSGFAYFSDRSSESWKILRKSEATSKSDVICGKKIEQITGCGNIEILHSSI